MAILTRSELQSIARAQRGPRISGPINESRAYSKSESVTSVFLSHSHFDRDMVRDAKTFFETLGISVYIDWADETMPERTNGTTAVSIKNKIINENDKFLLLATNNAVASKWCNWEIGIADPFKLHRNKMAIFPLADNSGAWNGNEYLQIYPRIERNPLEGGGYGYFVWDTRNNWTYLNTWLRQS